MGSPPLIIQNSISVYIYSLYIISIIHKGTPTRYVFKYIIYIYIYCIRMWRRGNHVWYCWGWLKSYISNILFDMDTLHAAVPVQKTKAEGSGAILIIAVPHGRRLCRPSCNIYIWMALEGNGPMAGCEIKSQMNGGACWFTIVFILFFGRCYMHFKSPALFSGSFSMARKFSIGFLYSLYSALARYLYFLATLGAL